MGPASKKTGSFLNRVSISECENNPVFSVLHRNLPDGGLRSLGFKGFL